MATTTNYGWTTPDNTDLVKDGALAIRTLGSAIDSNLSGAILQHVYSSYSTETTSSSNVMADTGLSVTITPKFATSKILIYASTQIFKSNGSSSNYMSLRLLRGATTVATPATAILLTGAAEESYQMFSYMYVDSPATTSATTYKYQFNSPGNTSFVRVQPGNTPGTIIALELKA